MDSPTSLQLINFPKFQNQHRTDFFSILTEFPPLESLLEIDSLSLSSCGYNSGVEGFQELMSINDCSWCYNHCLSWNEDILVSTVNTSPTTTGIVEDFNDSLGIMDKEDETRVTVSGRKRSVPLQLEEICKHFDVPITKAAKEMKVGLTVLKKRCRELKIMRWPNRKIRSLKSLIHSVKEMGLTHKIMMLEEHQRLLEKRADMEFNDTTKKLRQAIYKENYKKKRCLAAHHA